MERTLLRRLSNWQAAVLVLAAVAPAVIVGVLFARLIGAISTERMVEVALGAGETPGIIIFAAMFLASPVQWVTGRSQVSVRKSLGIIFYGLAVNSLVMFLVERSADAEEGLAAEVLGSPVLLAGIVALALATPLFLTSSRWSQRMLGMRRWRLLHRLTYVVAVALLVHVLAVPDVDLGVLLLLLGLVARIPSVRAWLIARGQRRKKQPGTASAEGDRAVLASGKRQEVSARVSS